MRASEIEKIIRIEGAERGITRVLKHLAERQSAVEQQVKEMGLFQLEMVKVVEQLTNAGGEMRKRIEAMQGRDEDDELPDALN